VTRAGTGFDGLENALQRVMRAVASAFGRRADDSLANVKFTDALEREIFSAGYRGKH